MSPIYKFDSASAMSQGKRPYQEDAFIANFAHGADVGFAVLSDGMGGHAAGDIASQIVVSEVFRELETHRECFRKDGTALPAILESAAHSANTQLREHVDANPATNGMGATLASCVVREDELYWISIGDSPLFLFRDNVLEQVNEDHSMGPHVDLLVKAGALTPEEGRLHPDRSVLTSVLFGEEIPLIDCPTAPLALKPGDVLILASDGLQYLPNDAIAKVLRERPFCTSAVLVNALMTAVEAQDDPDLDNVTIGIVQVQYAQADGIDG